MSECDRRGERVVDVRMGTISSRIYGFGIGAALFLLAAPLANPAGAQDVACGQAANDDADIEAAWTALNDACTCGKAKNEKKWRSERQSFVKCARTFAADAVKQGDIRASCKNDLVRAAKKSTCSRKEEAVTCCKISNNGTQSCSVFNKAKNCKSTRKRYAELGTSSSCLDACDDLIGAECTTDLQCDDGLVCTGDTCKLGRCQNILDPFCDPNDPPGDGGGGGGGGGDGGTSCTGKGKSTHGLSAEEKKLLDLMNNYRKKGKLSGCNSLHVAAQDHANDMRDKKYYAHKGKNGSEFWERACDAGYKGGCGPSVYMGEIITGWASTAEVAFQMWKNSPGHDYLMKEKAYSVAGIGHACGGPLGHYWVVDFASSSEASCK